MDRTDTASARPVATATPPLPPTAEVLGVPLALTDYERTLDWIDAAVAARTPGYVCVAAVHTVMACGEDPELRAAVRGASFTVPDGQPLVWARDRAVLPVATVYGHRAPAVDWRGG